MLKPFSLAILCIIALCACSNTENRLTFNPQPDEQRRYQLQTYSDITTTSRYGESSETVDSIMLMDYQVSEQRKTYQLRLTPRYMQLNYPGGSFNSMASPSHYDPEGFREMMSGGMTLTLNKRTGAAQSVEFNHPVEELGESGFSALQDELQALLSRPGLATGITLVEGEKIELESNAPLPPMTVTVVDLRKDRVTLQLRSENEESKLFGYMIVERDSGWPQLANVIITTPVSKPGVTGTVRTAISMTPDHVSGHLFKQLSQFDSREINSFAPPATQEPLNKEQVFAYRTGRIGDEWDALRFSYTPQAEDTSSLGRIELSELQAIDSEGEPLDIELHALQSRTYPDSLSPYLRTETSVWPLGWQLAAEGVERLAGAEATVDWYGQERHLLTLPLTNEVTEVAKSGARAILTPGKDDATYLLTLHSTREAYFQHDIEGPVAGAIDYQIDADTPDWATKTEGQFLGIGRYGSPPVILTLHFQEKPQELRIPLILLDKEPRGQQRVTFYLNDVLRNNVALPPPEAIQLYEQRSQPHGDERVFETTGLAEIEPETFGRPQLYLTLTREQAALCEPTLNSGMQVMTSDVIWKPLPSRHPPLRALPDNVIYQLATAVGEQTYFYQHEVEARLHCQGEPQWRPLELESGEQDWLVDLSELLGENWQQHQLASLPLAELFGRYRFLNKDGLALTVRPPPSSGTELTISESTLHDFATEEGQLVIAGHVDSVEHLHAAGKPITREWIHRFPDIPGYQGALYSSQEKSQ